MYAILNKGISLRSFWMIPYSYYLKNSSKAIGLNKEEFELLLKCDGNTEIKDSELFQELLKREMVQVCQKGEYELSNWQKYHRHDNRYMPMANIQITGKCNYNCKHCFNAKDNEPLQSEISFEEMKQLLDQFEKCGVHSFTITGGEPLLHRDFKKIIEEIYLRNMFVFELNTNGFFIDQNFLDWANRIGFKPLMKISFDGLGYHNWMRGNDKAEKKTLQAIKLCLDNGFKVKVQCNVNKKNLKSIVPTLELLDQMGVQETRIIKTTDAPRWLENGKGYSLSIEEYYDACYEIMKEYIQKERKMALTTWLLMYLNPEKHYFNFIPVECQHQQYRDSLPLCKGARGMIAVASNGNVYPCMQAQGYFDKNNIYLGNVFKEGLKSILQKSAYLNMVTTTVEQKLNNNSSCKNCQYFKYCVGGCPAVAILTSGHYLLEDKSKCIFFKQGYYKRFESLLKDYENMSTLD